MRLRNKKKNIAPEIYSELVLEFPGNTDIAPILQKLSDIGVEVIKTTIPKCVYAVEITIAEVNYKACWDIDEILTETFSSVENTLASIKEIICQNRGKILVSLAIYTDGNYPGIVFEKENMEKIHFLGANISIDMY